MERFLVNMDAYEVINYLSCVHECVVVTDFNAAFDPIFCREVHKDFAEIN